MGPYEMGGWLTLCRQSVGQTHVPNVEDGRLTGHPRGGGMSKWVEDERNLSTPRVTRAGQVHIVHIPLQE